MITNVLALWGIALLPVLMLLICWGIPIYLIYLFIRFLIQTDRERRKLRLEVGKLADEIQQLKQQLEKSQKG